jgi:hypothetical protein
MNINDLTIREAREIAAMVCGSKTSKSCSVSVGDKVFIRTVTYFYTGRVEAITDSDYVLSSAAWIVDTGRFSDALKSGEFAEVEPYPDSVNVKVSRGGIIDVCDWLHDFPRSRR